MGDQNKGFEYFEDCQDKPAYVITAGYPPQLHGTVSRAEYNAVVDAYNTSFKGEGCLLHCVACLICCDCCAAPTENFKKKLEIINSRVEVEGYCFRFIQATPSIDVWWLSSNQASNAVGEPPRQHTMNNEALV